MIVAPREGESLESYIRRAGKIAEALGMGPADDSWARMILEGGGEEEPRAFCPTGDGGGIDNSCSADDGSGGASPAPGGKGRSPSKQGKKSGAGAKKGSRPARYFETVGGKRVEITSDTKDVMLSGGKTTMQLDSEMRFRAHDDAKENRPDGGATTDLWDREFVTRSPVGKMIARTHGPFSIDRTIMGGTFVSHEDIAQYLSLRHEDQRKEIGGGSVGDTGIIDTTRELTGDQFDYLVDSITKDTLHAYKAGGFNPGFYSHDLKEAMDKMSTLHPELNTDENAKFVFTMLTAITSNGQDPNTNLVDADALYRMYKQAGTVVPASGQDVGEKGGGEQGEPGEEESGAGGNRDIRKSLALFQSMLESFGVDRTRRLMSGTTTVDRLNLAFQKLSKKTGDREWLARTGGQAWLQDRYAETARSTTNLVDQVKPKAGGAAAGSNEFSDEIVPMSAVFGPKIGSFFANLSGRHDFLTMDRWLMRSVGRITGELLTRSTPKTARTQATRALAAFKATSSDKILFGVEKKGISREDIVRSLQIQAKTGVVEENGAAYQWAKAAERDYKNTPKSPETGKGSFGKSQDKRHGAVIDEAHRAGNAIFKNLVFEQQVPRGAQARRTIREVFRAVRDNIEKERGERVDVDEVQAIMWQYEKNLWKHLGGKVVIDKNSLYSKAADLLLARTKVKSLRPEKKKTAQEIFTEKKQRDDGQEPIDIDFDLYRFGAEQAFWDSEIQESGVDFNQLFLDLEGDSDDEESRSATCEKAAGGRFARGNDCAAGDGGSVDVDRSWRRESKKHVFYDMGDGETKPPAKSLKDASVVLIPAGRALYRSLKILGVKLDDVAKVAGADTPGAEVVVGHGDMKNLIGLLDVDGGASREEEGMVTVLSKGSVVGIKSAISAGVTVWRDAEDRDKLKVAYEFLGVSPEAQSKASIAVGREMIRGAVASIKHAAAMGAEEITMLAAGDEKNKDFKGYRIWPRLGFDGVIPRDMVTPKWSIASGFFTSYGSRIPPSALSPRAKREIARGELTVQALWETKEGQKWWERNGRSIDLTLRPKDKRSLGWKRFAREYDSRDFEDMWVESRAFCPTGEGGGVDNSCGDDAGGPPASSADSKDWGKTDKSVERHGKWSPLFPGAERFAEITIRSPSVVRAVADKARMSMSDIVLASGCPPEALGRAGMSPAVVGVEAHPGNRRFDPDRIVVTWHSSGRIDSKDANAEAKRVINVRHDGDISVNLAGIYIDGPARGQGIALDALARTASNPRIKEISMLAERFDADPKTGMDMIGYRVWPKYGFDAPIESVQEVTRRAGGVPKEFRDCKTLQDILARPGGREWWSVNGAGIFMYFDNRPGSRSRQILDDVLAAAAKKHGAKK